jgi:hypothetical protein
VRLCQRSDNIDRMTYRRRCDRERAWSQTVRMQPSSTCLTYTSVCHET